MILMLKEKTSMDGKRLRRLRLERNLTQSDLGKKINVTKVSISGYESGDRTPDTDNLRRLANFFDVTTDYLLGSTDNPNKVAESDRERIMHKIATEFPDIDLMFHDLEGMSAEDLQDVYDFIKFKKSQQNK